MCYDARMIDTDDPRHPTVDIDVFDSLRKAIASNSRDWSEHPADAWLYAIIAGWGDALPRIAALHGWDDDAVVRLRMLRAVFVMVEEQARLDWRLMARAIERAGLPATLIRTPYGCISNCSLVAGYDERECQICGGACPDKARYER